MDTLSHSYLYLIIYLEIYNISVFNQYQYIIGLPITWSDSIRTNWSHASYRATNSEGFVSDCLGSLSTLWPLSENVLA